MGDSFSPAPPVVHQELLGLSDAELEAIGDTPPHKTLHQSSALRLAVVPDAADDGERWSSLGGASAAHQHIRLAGPQSQALWSAGEAVRDPGHQAMVHPQESRQDRPPLAAAPWQPIKLFLNNAGCVRSSGRSQNYVHLTKQDYENSFLTGELFWSFFFSRRAGFVFSRKAKTGYANRLPLAAPWQPIQLLNNAGRVQLTKEDYEKLFTCR